MLYVSQEDYHKICKKSRFLFTVISIGYDVFKDFYAGVPLVTYREKASSWYSASFVKKSALKDDQGQNFNGFGSKRLR